ncbi:FAD-dependent monooxygenase [Pseudonocardia lacus]|uniref:FAD-dependent monooxygenase n=1 Tax=Pseudonocardia lacus TaxID=2835865 RepID=UPI001BDC533B|nr:FAD-dependent monooxygenase [Pseudonocardia lacus]
MSGKTVLVSGAGIAGSAVAFWLRRFGFVPTVVERSAAPRPGGHAVDLRGASKDVVERMGLLDAVRERALHERGMAMVDARGRRRAEMPAEAFDGRGAVAEIEILRGDLAEILVAATGDGVEYRYGDHITALEQDADGVRVRFASGREQRFDLVVGADGSHSAVRALVFGPEADHTHPLGAYTAHYSISAERATADGLDRDDWFVVHNAPGRRMVGTRPDRDGGVKAMYVLGADGVDEAVLRDPTAQRALLHERFAGMGWQTPALLAAMDTAEDFYFDAYTQVKMPTWVGGRVVLLGDAGYCPSPASGQGTNLALVGAYVLAGELAAAGGDPAGLAAYESAMREYVERNQKLMPGGVGAMIPKSAPAIRMGHLLNRVMMSRPLRPLAARAFAAEDPFTPRDYAAEPTSPTRCT